MPCVCCSDGPSIDMLFSSLRQFSAAAAAAPTKERLLQLIQRKANAGSMRSGPRRGWQVKAAAWVKRAHIDRGDKKVGLFSATSGDFHIIEDLRPRYIVPDLNACKLKPYVSHYQPPARLKANEQAT